jgi:ABC-type polysaccharide/polyol phosphate export permease
MRDIADLLPLTHLTAALRAAWLHDQVAVEDLWWLAGWMAVGLVLVAVAASANRSTS